MSLRSMNMIWLGSGRILSSFFRNRQTAAEVDLPTPSDPLSRFREPSVNKLVSPRIEP
jgi:hypothetical protein